MRVKVTPLSATLSFVTYGRGEVHNREEGEMA